MPLRKRSGVKLCGARRFFKNLLCLLFFTSLDPIKNHSDPKSFRRLNDQHFIFASPLKTFTHSHHPHDQRDVPAFPTFSSYTTFQNFIREMTHVAGELTAKTVRAHTRTQRTQYESTADSFKEYYAKVYIDDVTRNKHSMLKQESCIIKLLGSLLVVQVPTLDVVLDQSQHPSRRR